MARPSFPKNMYEFHRQFASEEACQDYLAACRWPDGFVCPRWLERTLAVLGMCTMQGSPARWVAIHSKDMGAIYRQSRRR